MTSHRLSHLLKTTLWFLLALTVAQACGPDFFPDTFVRSARPDLPNLYVKGQLGILQSSFPRADLLVAYRYLNGGTLDGHEQKGWSPTYPLSEQYYGQNQEQTPAEEPAGEAPASRWTAARTAFDDPPGPVEQERKIKIHTAQGYEYETSFLNCSDDAFRTAVRTLRDRERQWGAKSEALRNWIYGQDAVFKNCDGGRTLPEAAPAGSPPLLVQDRAYQTAAAEFYSMDFEAARAGFAAIGQDRASPWRPIAGYLVARALIRQAYFARPQPADYDPALMKAAQQQLQAYVAENPPSAMRSAALAQLALVRIRTEPEQRARELGLLVGGPDHDDRYAQDLQDLLWVAEEKTPDGLRAQPQPWMQVPDELHPGSMRTATKLEIESATTARRSQAYAGSAQIREAAPILDWAITLQALAPESAQHALKMWQSTRSLPWMVAALMLTPNDAAFGKGTQPEDLLAAAAMVPPDSPAWQTIAYHRARLLLAAGRATDARTVLREFSARLEKASAAERPPSSVNALRGLMMTAAPSEAEFFSYILRTAVLWSSEEYSSVRECREVMKNPARRYDCVASVESLQMDADAAAALNRYAPLSLWLQAAKSTSLSAQLRLAVATEGWTRAILLSDKDAAAAFVALLPEKLREQAAQNSVSGPWMTLLRNPGLRPYVNAGTQRAYSYDFVESYRDNWCYQPDENRTAIAPAFLSREERQRGINDAQKLEPIRSVFVGQQIVRQVEEHPENPDSAEALFLVLRMIRYGCVEPAAPASANTPQTIAITYTPEAKELLELKQHAARLLRRHYAGSPWTRKAAPFVG